MTNKPMLSVERVHCLKIHRKPFLDLESGGKTGEIRDCSDRDFQVGDNVILVMVDETGNPTPNELHRKITHVQTGYGLPDDLCVLSYEPAAQHHGEPVTDDQLIETARKAALNSTHRYSYMPATQEDASSWLPHRWVVEAMRDAVSAEQPAPVAVQVSWADVEPWYIENEQMLRDVGKFEGLKGVALEVWRAARLNGVKP